MAQNAFNDPGVNTKVNIKTDLPEILTAFSWLRISPNGRVL